MLLGGLVCIQLAGTVFVCRGAICVSLIKVRRLRTYRRTAMFAGGKERDPGDSENGREPGCHTVRIRVADWIAE